MFATHAVCTECGRRHALERVYRCESCGAPLDVQYQYADISPAAFDPTCGSRADGIWIHHDLLPASASYAVTLGEGRTPLLRCERIGQLLGLSCLLAKDETRQPTGSFKDRPLSVAVSRARELGVDTVTTASSGNAAASMVAYAARAGLRAVVFVPSHTPASKLLQIAASGAKIVRVTGSVSDSMALAHTSAREFGWYNVTTTFENPYSVEGDKTVAYEIAADLGWRAPRWIIVPVGAGPLLAGIWKGFCEMQRAGLVNMLPRMVAAQAAGCAPIARAFRAGAGVVLPWDSPRTIASGIQDPLAGYSQDGTYTLKIVRQSLGTAVAVSDEAILRAIRLMDEAEGLYMEPSAGAAVAALTDLLQDGSMASGDEVVVVSTGHGLKQPFATENELQDIPEISPTLQSLRALDLDTFA
ncbi:MAG: threonine synthase [Armatimonadetes bacterium]|nr:threonine synthase [Armatimonadota bacterium]